MKTRKLTIKQPSLITDKEVTRATCIITEEDTSGNIIEKNVTFDVEKRWGRYLVTENVNAYLVALLPYAMRNQMDIELLAPVSSELLHNVEMFLIPHLVRYDSRLHSTRIHAKHIDTTILKNAGAVGTGMSMGVDSFHTVHQYLNPKYNDLKLTHLLVEQVGDLIDGVTSKKHKRNVNNQTVDEVADRLNLPVIHSYSNIRQVFKMSHYHTHTYSAMFNVHMMAKLFKQYFYASAADFTYFDLINNSTRDAAHHELLSLQSLSTNSIRLISGGASSDRTEKTKELANNDVARDFLRVCLMEELNCMECRKCRRTLLTLDMQGNLNKFKKVFNVSVYKKNKESYLKWLIMSYHKDSKGISIKQLYDFFYSTEKTTMERLEKWHMKNYEPLKSPGYFRVKSNVRKLNPVTGKNHLRTFSKGEYVYFVDALYFNDGIYLRSKKDSLKGKFSVIPRDKLNRPGFKAMKSPRRLRLARDIQKVNPYTGTKTGKVIESGSNVNFSDTITIKNTQYLRTSRDSFTNTDLAIPKDSLIINK